MSAATPGPLIASKREMFATKFFRGFFLRGIPCKALKPTLL